MRQKKTMDSDHDIVLTSRKTPARFSQNSDRAQLFVLLQVSTYMSSVPSISLCSATSPYVWDILPSLSSINLDVEKCQSAVKRYPATLGNVGHIGVPPCTKIDQRNAFRIKRATFL